MKKIIAMVAAFALCLTMFAGCTSTGTGDTASKDADKVYEVGVIQQVQHVALDAATEGFKAALTEKLGDKVNITVQNAAGEAANCGTIANQFVSAKVDLIMANATGALQAAYAATAKIPIVATSITDYATALEIDNWTGKTGFNVTGTSDLAPLDQQAQMIKDLFPDAKTVGILYCSGEANSKYQSTVMQGHLTKLGFTCKEYTFADSNDVQAITTTACQNSDVIFIPTDNTAASCTGTIDGVAAAAKTPIVAGEEGICKGCGVATLSIDYRSIGYEAGLMAYEILVNGKDPKDMEIGFATELTKKYVESRCTALDVTVPEGYVAIDLDAK
ncbi:MAG: ABC transporter substrate-binding protein [Clostridia bacterium]|nr:ABC transporter substrate-binding protein [Clostridia bacterium]